MTAPRSLTGCSRIALGRLALALGLAALVGCGRELVCSSDQTACGDTCAAIATDPQHCGACGNACAAGESCSAGLCRCPDGRVDCGGACADLASDPAHCGACGVACAPGAFCTTAAGGATGCADACAQETQTACGQACVDLSSDRWSCGACGRACGTGERCASGECAADLYLACYNSNELREATRDLAAAGIPVPVAPGPISLARADGLLYIASAQPGGVETLTRLLRDPPAVRADAVLETGVPSPDLQYLAEHGGLLYLSQASIGRLLVATPDGAVVEEFSLASGENPNPQGIAFSGDKAYVALNQTNEVVVLDVSACQGPAPQAPCVTELTRIDVQPLASDGALARPSRIAVVGGRVFVTLWNLDASWAPPAGSTGRLAVIDAATGALDPTVNRGGPAGLVDLGATCLNPADAAEAGGTLYVSCGAFDYSGPEVKLLGAGIVPVDLGGPVPEVEPILPAAESAAPGELAFCSGFGYVADRNSGRVFRLGFDPTDPTGPTAGAIDGVELCSPEGGFAFVADIACGF